jgi:hypothetical protein
MPCRECNLYADEYDTMLEVLRTNDGHLVNITTLEILCGK